MTGPEVLKHALETLKTHVARGPVRSITLRYSYHDFGHFGFSENMPRPATLVMEVTVTDMSSAEQQYLNAKAMMANPLMASVDIH